MEGFLLLKTNFQNNREIVAVNFDGANNYDLFVKEGKSLNYLYECNVVQKCFIYILHFSKKKHSIFHWNPK